MEMKRLKEELSEHIQEKTSEYDNVILNLREDMIKMQSFRKKSKNQDALIIKKIDEMAKSQNNTFGVSNVSLEEELHQRN
mmetsp:Transcript_31074/g.30527  ORF Transcript_31074/g.30527 Transcript_31074/m.30527 type:complete len:80 (+) Transcript_31074:223-462(+)